MTRAAVIAAALAALLASAGWLGHRAGAAGVQQRWDAAQIAQGRAAVAALEAASRETTRWQLAADKAEKEAKAYEAQSRVAAVAARVADGRVRDTLARADRRIATATRQAVDQYARAAGAVFGECVQAYRGVAEAADGHAADVQRLSGAWPAE